MSNSELKTALSGPPEIVVSTPACIKTCLDAKILLPKAIEESLSMLVLDEADLLLSYGHEADVMALAKYKPPGCQCLLMSATSRLYSADMEKVKKLMLHNPHVLTLSEIGDKKDEIIPKDGFPVCKRREYHYSHSMASVECRVDHDVIRHSVLKRHPDCESFPCNFFGLTMLDFRAYYHALIVSCTLCEKAEEDADYYTSNECKFKDFIRANYPTLSEACAEKVAGKFSDLLRSANANHECRCKGLDVVSMTTSHSLRFEVRRREKDCPICMDAMPETKKTLNMRCSHTFHRRCLDRWLNKHHTCPVCRYHFPAEDVKEYWEDRKRGRGRIWGRGW